jgi:hypothetical protein
VLLILATALQQHGDDNNNPLDNQTPVRSDIVNSQEVVDNPHNERAGQGANNRATAAKETRSPNHGRSDRS